LGATGAGKKRKLPKRLGPLIKSAAQGLENNSSDIAKALVKDAIKGKINSTKLLIKLAEQEAAEADSSPEAPFEKSNWVKLAKEPPYQGPGPLAQKTAKSEDGNRNPKG